MKKIYEAAKEILSEKYNREDLEKEAQRLSKVHNVPYDVVKHVINKETGGTWKTNLVNPKSGATGIMQILPQYATNSPAGYEVDKKDLLDPYKSMNAGVKKLGQWYHTHRNKKLSDDQIDVNAAKKAMASYNAGPHGGVVKDKQGNVTYKGAATYIKTGNPKHLPPETQNYIKDFGVDNKVASAQPSKPLKREASAISAQMDPDKHKATVPVVKEPKVEVTPVVKAEVKPATPNTENPYTPGSYEHAFKQARIDGKSEFVHNGKRVAVKLKESQEGSMKNVYSKIKDILFEAKKERVVTSNIPSPDEARAARDRMDAANRRDRKKGTYGVMPLSSNNYTKYPDNSFVKVYTDPALGGKGEISIPVNRAAYDQLKRQRADAADKDWDKNGVKQSYSANVLITVPRIASNNSVEKSKSANVVVSNAPRANTVVVQANNTPKSLVVQANNTPQANTAPQKKAPSARKELSPFEKEFARARAAKEPEFTWKNKEGKPYQVATKLKGEVQQPATTKPSSTPAKVTSTAITPTKNVTVSKGEMSDIDSKKPYVTTEPASTPKAPDLDKEKSDKMWSDLRAEIAADKATMTSQQLKDLEDSKAEFKQEIDARIAAKEKKDAEEDKQRNSSKDGVAEIGRREATAKVSTAEPSKSSPNPTPSPQTYIKNKATLERDAIAAKIASGEYDPTNKGMYHTVSNKAEDDKQTKKLKTNEETQMSINKKFNVSDSLYAAVMEVMKKPSQGSIPKNEKEKDLAAMSPPGHLITHGDVLKARGVSMKEAKKLDPVGKEDEDVDNDGKMTSSDSYLKNRRKAIGAAIKEGTMRNGKYVDDAPRPGEVPSPDEGYRGPGKPLYTPVDGKKATKKPQPGSTTKAMEEETVQEMSSKQKMKLGLYNKKKNVKESIVASAKKVYDKVDRTMNSLQHDTINTLSGRYNLGSPYEPLRGYGAEPERITNPHYTPGSKNDPRNIPDPRNLKKAVKENTDTPGNSYEHQCAIHVKSESFGEGRTITTQHADPDQNGNIAWYDVMFEHGIERYVPTAELEILVSESHMHSMKKKKKVTEAVRGYVDSMTGARPPENQAERDRLAREINTNREINRSDTRTTGYGNRVTPQKGIESSGTGSARGPVVTTGDFDRATPPQGTRVDPKATGGYGSQMKIPAGSGKMGGGSMGGGSMGGGWGMGSSDPFSRRGNPLKQ